MIECTRENYDADGMLCRGHASAQKDMDLRERNGLRTSTRIENVHETSEWETRFAVGDAPAALMQRSGHPGIVGAGYALDAADVASFQSRAVTSGQIKYEDTYSYTALYDANNGWKEMMGTRSVGTLTNSLEVSNTVRTHIEYRGCVASGYGCSQAW